MNRHDRLSCEIAIWADVVLEHGLAAFVPQRSKDLRLRPPKELAHRWNIPVWAIKRTCAALRKEGIISDHISHLNRYLILKPAAYYRGLSVRFARRLGQPVLLNLPPALRNQQPKQVVDAVAHALKSPDEDALAVLHTALAVEDPWLTPARVYRGPGPVTLALASDDLRDVSLALNLVKLRTRSRERSKINPLGLPEGFAFADVLIFSRRPDVKLRINVGPWSHLPPMEPAIRPMNPVANALLLSFFSLRGEEVAERLIDILCANPKISQESNLVESTNEYT